MNPDLYLCTLAKDLDFQLEATVRRGRGYVTAEENYDAEMELGVIPVDAVIRGCPPTPLDLMRGLLEAIGKRTAGK